MRVFTVVRQEEWEKAKETGILRRECDITDASRSWVTRQMALRVPGFSGALPIFGWTNIPEKDYDLYGKEGDQMVLVEAEVPDDRVVRYHFMGWELAVQIGMYLSLSAEEDAEADEKTLSQDEIERSWENIFNPEALSAYIPDDTIGLLIDGIRASEVVRTRNFVVKPLKLNMYSEKEDVMRSFEDPLLLEELRGFRHFTVRTN